MRLAQLCRHGIVYIQTLLNISKFNNMQKQQKHACFQQVSIFAGVKFAWLPLSPGSEEVALALILARQLPRFFVDGRFRGSPCGSTMVPPYIAMLCYTSMLISMYINDEYRIYCFHLYVAQIIKWVVVLFATWLQNTSCRTGPTASRQFWVGNRQHMYMHKNV